MRLSEFLHNIGRPVAYFPELAKLLGGVKEAIFLCQLAYWDGKQADSEGWIYKTSAEIEEETGLSRWEQEHARKRLKALGVLEEKHAGLPRRVYYRVNEEALEALWQEHVARKQLTQSCANNIVEEPQHSTRKTSKQVCGKTSNCIEEKPQTITEITTENTTETTTENTDNLATHRQLDKSTGDGSIARDIVVYLYERLRQVGVQKSPRWFAKQVSIAKNLMSRYPPDAIRNVIDFAMQDRFWRGAFTGLEYFESVYQKLLVERRPEGMLSDDDLCIRTAV